MRLPRFARGSSCCSAGVTLDVRGTARIPYRNSDGTLFRERLLPARGRPWWGPGEGLIPLGLEMLPPPPDAEKRALLIAEGESDVLALREAFAGVSFDNPIRGYHVLGVPGAGLWRDEWASFAAGFPLVYPIGDGDARGRELNAAIRRSIPWARPVWLPEGEDARALLQRSGSRALDPLLEQADRDAELIAAFLLADDLAAFEALLGGEVRDVA
jgi:hypothetical protein